MNTIIEAFKSEGLLIGIGLICFGTLTAMIGRDYGIPCIIAGVACVFIWHRLTAKNIRSH